VIAHQSDQSRCDVVDIARWLRDNHYAGVVVDLAGDWDGILAATVKAMRDRGSGSVQLLGASMGGTISMIVAAQVSPPVDSVVSLGGERRAQGGYDADAAVARSHVPLFVVTSEDDGFLNGDEARILISESASQDKKALIIPGMLHGFAMLDGPDAARVKQAILDFLSAHVRN
jgi:dienelactone hydrolase